MNNSQPLFKNERRNTKVRHLFDAIRPVALHEDEKSRIRMTLNAFTVRYPARDEAIHNRTHDRVPLMVRFIQMMPAMAAFGIAVLLGGGISVSAESALPGSSLYTVKVAVNERVRGFFTPSLSGKAEWDMELALRRLEEAEELAIAGNLTPELSAELANNLEKYSAGILARTTTMSERDQVVAALSLNNRFEASLRVHERILRGLIGTAQASEPMHQEISALAEAVKAKAEKAAAHQNANEEKVLMTDTTSLERRAKDAESIARRALLESNLLIQNRKALLGGELSLAAETKLGEASAAFNVGATALADKSHRNAFLAFQSAFQNAEEARLLITLQGNFNLVLPQ